MSIGGGALESRTVVHRLSGAPANDALALPPATVRPHALLRVVPKAVHLGESQRFVRDLEVFRWRSMDADDPEPVFESPWDAWLDDHPEEVRRHAGRYVALHPTLGVYAAADTFEELCACVRARDLPAVQRGDLLLTSFDGDAMDHP